MKTIRYIKKSYLYDDFQFFLYEPIELDIVSEKYKTNGEAEEIKYTEDGEEKIFKHNRYYSIVKAFTPTPKCILRSEYEKKPIYVSCVERILSCKGVDKRHLKCEVLSDKRGAYTMLKCDCCGDESPIALNSWDIWKEGDSFDFDCKQKVKIK